MLDDVGVDRVAAYGLHPRPAHTPRMDALAESGVRFTEAYAAPVCTVGRAATLTGLRPRRTGVGNNPLGGTPFVDGLPLIEATLAEVLDDTPAGSYTSAAIGKWHLSNLERPDAFNPNRQGFDHFDGQLGTPKSHVGPVPSGLRGYSYWQRVVDGDTTMSSEYLTTAQADAAIDTVGTLPEPWFVYLAFSAVHLPLEEPPRSLFTGPDPVDDSDVADAMLEAADHELGRVLDAVGDGALVIVTADNGTSGVVVRPPLDAHEAKGSVYAGGTQVPLIVAGRGIAPAVSASLISVTDIFATVLDLAGVRPADVGFDLDGTSFLGELTNGTPSSRRCVVTEWHPGDWEAAVRDDHFTLVRHPQGPDELYRRQDTLPRETADLLDGDHELTTEEHTAYRELKRALRADP